MNWTKVNERPHRWITDCGCSVTRTATFPFRFVARNRHKTRIGENRFETLELAQIAVEEYVGENDNVDASQ